MTTFFASKHFQQHTTRSTYFDPNDIQRDQTVTLTTAPTFPAFKFEARRARIDWRLLHGVDINPIVSKSAHLRHHQRTCNDAHMQIRDVDLDTLEKVTSIIAFGDIEAEDTRHLTELNFIKVGNASAASPAAAPEIR